MAKDLEVLKIGIPKLKKLYENNAKKMGETDILGFDLTFAYLDKALQRLQVIDNAIVICQKANEQKYVYIKADYGIVKEKFLDDLDYEVFKNRLYVNSRGLYYNFSLNDYGKEWALTKEELEDVER